MTLPRRELREAEAVAATESRSALDRLAEALRLAVFGPDITPWRELDTVEREPWLDGVRVVLDSADRLDGCPCAGTPDQKDCPHE